MDIERIMLHSTIAFHFQRNPNTLIEKLVILQCELVGASKNDVQIGYSKVFMKEDLATILDFIVLHRVKAAARCLKRFRRRVIRRHATRVLTTWVKFRLHAKELYRRMRASNRMRAVCKMYYLKCLFTKYIQAVKKMQSCQRVSIAKETVYMIKDPYANLNCKQIEGLLAKKQKELSVCLER